VVAQAGAIQTPLHPVSFPNCDKLATCGAIRKPGLPVTRRLSAKDGKTVCFFRADKKYMTFGFSQEADLTCEEGAPHQLIESAWYFTALDDATEAKLSAIVRKFAS
jgi:hypothetical protein